MNEIFGENQNQNSSNFQGGGVASRNDGSSDGDTLASVIHSYTDSSVPRHNKSSNLSDSSPKVDLTDFHWNEEVKGCNEAFFGDSDCSLTTGILPKDREERLKIFKIRQQEERQRKLEELKEQAASAHRFREQQEAARRSRFEEMRSRDQERRQQVEERKRMIEHAERERKEAVIKKNTEREQRVELKRRQERSNVVFAFGSSTPRMLDPRETVHPDFYSSRRSTSTTNVNAPDGAAATSVPRRPSESQPSDLSKKRAVSAHNLNRKPNDLRMSTSMYEVFHWNEGESDRAKTPVDSNPDGPSKQGEDSSCRAFEKIPQTAGRRRTDLIPTIPQNRFDGNLRSPGHKSGNVTPAASDSRPTSAQSQSPSSVSGPQKRPNRTSPKKPRPLSIAGTFPTAVDKPRDSKASASPAAASLHSSFHKDNRFADKRLSSGSIDGSKSQKSKSSGASGPDPVSSTPLGNKQKTHPRRTPAQVKAESAARKTSEKKTAPKPRPSPKAELPASPTHETSAATPEMKDPVHDDSSEAKVTKPVPIACPDSIEDINEIKPTEPSISKPDPVPECTPKVEPPLLEDTSVEESVMLQPMDLLTNAIVSCSSELEEKSPLPGIAGSDKSVVGYANEEEYKAVLAEKRRLAREAKERELELERQRELEEAEKERREEEEYLRLMDEQRKAEEERLRIAIEEAEKQRQLDAQKRDEEEKQRLEAEKIEQEKRLEAEERMRKEEEERLMRKSRVAAIMSRTRGAKGSPSTPSKSDASTPLDESKTLNNSLMSESMTESLINRLSSSMTDSMIVQEIQKHHIDAKSTDEPASSDALNQASTTAAADAPAHAPSESAGDLPESVLPHINGNGRMSNGNETQILERTTEEADSVVVGSSDKINGILRNGSGLTSHRTTNAVDFDPFSPLSSGPEHSAATDPAVTFDQIIDLSLHSNPKMESDGGAPAPPLIAFEDNFVKSSQEGQSSVPDILL